jgi:hypothetical protein
MDIALGTPPVRNRIQPLVKPSLERIGSLRIDSVKLNYVYAFLILKHSLLLFYLSPIRLKMVVASGCSHHCVTERKTRGGCVPPAVPLAEQNWSSYP